MTGCTSRSSALRLSTRPARRNAARLAAAATQLGQCAHILCDAPKLGGFCTTLNGPILAVDMIHGIVCICRHGFAV